MDREARSSGQVLHFGVAAGEPPGTSLSEAQLFPVILGFVAPEDWPLVDRDSATALKCERIKRIVPQAYEQGVALSLPDIAYLMGLSTDAVANTMAQYEEVLLPTRGSVSNMGPTLSHADKIIDPYMWGYTEMEVKQTAGHSIERYLIDLSRVTYLIRKGLPAPAILLATGLSKRMVKKYVELYEQYSGPDFSFRMGHILAIARAHPPK